MRVVTGIQCFYVVIFIIQSKAKSSRLTPTSTTKKLSTTVITKCRSPSSSPSLTPSSPTTDAINVTTKNNGLSSWWTRSTIKPSSTTQPNTASSSLQDSSSSVHSKSSTNNMTSIPSASLALTSATSINEHSPTTQPSTAGSSLQDSSSSVHSKSSTNNMTSIPSASLALTSTTSINEYSPTTQPNTAISSLKDSSSFVYSKSTTNSMTSIPSASLALTSTTSINEYSPTTQPNTSNSSLKDLSSSVYSTSTISNMTSIPEVPFGSILSTTTYVYHSSIQPIRTSSSLQDLSSLVYSTSTRSIITTIPNVTLVPKSATATYYSSSTTQQNTTSPTDEFRTTQKPTELLEIIYIKVEISMTIINVEVHKNDECGHDSAEKVSELFSTCNSLKIKEWYNLFYEYLQCKMCSVDGINKDTCSMEIIDLRCGSVITTFNMIVRVNNTESSLDDVNNVFKKIKEKGKIKELQINSTSFNFTNQGEVERTSFPTPTLSPDITIVEVKLNYERPEFCRIRDIFKSKIAASCEPEGEKLKRSDIYIMGEKRMCRRRPDDVEKSIVVQFYVLKNNPNKKTAEVYDCLKNKLEQGKLDLGNFFNDKIVSIGLKDEHVSTTKPAPVARTLSDGEKVWLAVGLTLATLLLLLVLYLCCCRRKTNEDKDAERGSDHFVLDNIDGTKKESVVLVNDGFDSQEDNDPPKNSLSTFKGKEPDKPLNGDIEEKKAPLGDGEETDDELGMTVPDVAIEEPQKSKSTPTKAPPHMATTDLAQEKREFEDLNQTKADPAAYPIKDSDKNRVPSIVPNPDTRVTLKGENDYINANFIKDHQGNKAFIATQHPLSNTMRDFWSMVWQHDVEVIVMVNNDEKNTADYHNYWMNQKSSLSIHGHMQVKTEGMQKMDAFNITTFTLKNSQENAVTKTVQHFRFTNWPNQDVPDIKEFIQFMTMAEKAISKNVKSPVVVHCSDGQGYTGVFIAVAIGSRVYEESGKKSIVDVFDCVSKMRSDRNQIVSSKELFAYIYKVFEALTNGSNISDSRL